MSKEISTPLARTSRLLDLVPYLNAHQGISLKDLAQHFNVTPAQMSADLTTLWMCGLPGYTPLELMDLEFESGFVTIRNAETLSKPRSITFQEGVALILGLDLLIASLPSDRDDLKAVTASLRERITTELGVPVHIQVSPNTSSAVSVALQRSLNDGTGLRIQYHSLYKDSVTSRLITPIEMYESNGNQYLRAFCFSAKDYREFRTDRIMEAVEETVPSLNGDPAPITDKIQYEITTNVALRDIAERFAVKNVAEGSLFLLSSYSDQWIEKSVLASGAAVTLETPLDLRTQLQRTALEMLRRYEKA